MLRATPPPHVLVLLAAFNGVKFLTDQIISLLKQECVTVHIAISIDKSIDGTEDFLLQWSQQDERIAVLPRGKVFGGASANFFRLLSDVDMSQFTHVALADQDDIWDTQKLVRACAQLQTTGAAAYSSNVIAFWPDGTKRLIDKAQPQQRWDFLFEGPGPGCTFVLTQPMAMALQNWVRDHATPLKSVDFHDWLIYAWARANGYIWLIDPWPSLQYRQHGNNQFGANTGTRAMLLRAKRIANGWWFDQTRQIVRLLELEEQPFVVSWFQGQRLGLLQLAWYARNCRRRRRDQWLFALSCLWMAVYLPRRRLSP